MIEIPDLEEEQEQYEFINQYMNKGRQSMMFLKNEYDFKILKWGSKNELII